MVRDSELWSLSKHGKELVVSFNPSKDFVIKLGRLDDKVGLAAEYYTPKKD